MSIITWRTNTGAIFLLYLVAVIPSSGQTLTTLATFNGTNGADPYASLVQGIDGNLYGTTLGKGAFQGTVFKVTTGGMLTVLGALGRTYPIAAVVQGRNGNLYGTTQPVNAFP